MKTLAKTKDMSREEWLEYRKKGIGGSDAPIIAGVNPWKSAVELYMEKTGEIEPQQAGEKAYWGQKLEALVAEEFQERTGKKVRKNNNILQHLDHPFIIANIDREIVGEKAGLEIKTTDGRNRPNWIDRDEVTIPDYVNIQVHHYMLVTGYQYWYIAVLIGGNEFHYTHLERDEELIELLVQMEKDFWARVENQDPPPMDGSDGATELLKTMYPEGKPEKIPLPDTAAELAQRREELRQQEKELEKQRKEAENQLKDLLGENEAGIVKTDDTLYEIKWKNVNSSKFDQKKLKEDKPEIYEQYITNSGYRRFEIKQKEVKTDD